MNKKHTICYDKVGEKFENSKPSKTWMPYLQEWQAKECINKNSSKEVSNKLWIAAQIHNSI